MSIKTHAFEKLNILNIFSTARKYYVVSEMGWKENHHLWWTGSPQTCRRKFQQHAQLIFGGPLNSKEEEEQWSYLLLWVGDKVKDIFNSWDGSSDDSKKFDSLYEHFKNHVQPKLNPVYARYKFNTEVQGNTIFDQFVNKLELLSKDCSYTNVDEMIRDRIVFAVASPKIRIKLINVGRDLTLDKAIEIGQNFEYSQEQLKSIGNNSSEVHAIHANRRPASGLAHGASRQNPPKKIPDPPNKSSGDSARSDSNKDPQRVRMRNARTMSGYTMNNRLVLLKAKDMTLLIGGITFRLRADLS